MEESDHSSDVTGEEELVNELNQLLLNNDGLYEYLSDWTHRYAQDIVDEQDDHETNSLFYMYLLNHVDVQKEIRAEKLSKWGVGEFEHLMPEYERFCDNHTMIGPNGEKLPSKEFYDKGPFWDKNLTYYRSIREELERELTEGNKLEVPAGGWTIDTWNEAQASHVEQLLHIDDDPQLKPLVHLQKHWFGEEIFCCGSFAEKIVTSFIGLAELGDTDFDIMYCEPLPGELLDIGTRPGYVKIRLDEDDPRYPKDQNNFLLAANYKLITMEGLEQRRQTLHPTHEGKRFIAGPAIALYSDGSKNLKTLDRVQAFYREDRQWPTIAQEWPNRNRFSGWPTKELIEKVVSYGTYIVPFAHPNSLEPEIECRYSFSKPEIDLMLSITKRQRKCYLLTKRLCSLMFSGFKIFCSYYLKTTFFWMLEEMPNIWWEWMCMDGLVNFLLDKLLSFFDGPDHFLPNFFIQSINLIDHLPTEHVETVWQVLKRVQLRNDQALPQYVLKDANLFLINDTVEPCDEFSKFSLPQYKMVTTSVRQDSLVSVPSEVSECYFLSNV